MKHSLLSIIAALLLCAGLLAFALYIATSGTSPMFPLMKHYAPPEDTRLPAAEYEPVVEMITEYLLGNRDYFQHIFSVDGTEYAAFNTKEQQHMQDVQALFALCRPIGLFGLGISIALIAEFHLFSEERTLRTFRRTLLCILAVVTALIIAAVIDFNALFILFHRIAFTNDLWLLDPQTDLLIRLMPIEFFISYAAIIGGIWLLGMTMLLILSTLRIKKMQANERE